MAEEFRADGWTLAEPQDYAVPPERRIANTS